MNSLPDRVLALARVLPEPERTILDQYHGLTGAAVPLSELAKSYSMRRMGIGLRLANAYRLLLVALDQPDVTDAQLPDLLVAGGMRERSRRPDPAPPTEGTP